jgi:quinol monooxygenase YgiN
MKTTYPKDQGVSVMRFARNVHFQIKNGKEQEFATLFEKEVIPMLRKQSGFRDELTLVNKDGSLDISVWDDRRSADAYQTAAYPQVLAKLNHLIDGTPKVQTYEVGATTLPITPAPPA